MLVTHTPFTPTTAQKMAATILGEFSRPGSSRTNVVPSTNYAAMGWDSTEADDEDGQHKRAHFKSTIASSNTAISTCWVCCVCMPRAMLGAYVPPLVVGDVTDVACLVSGCVLQPSVVPRTDCDESKQTRYAGSGALRGTKSSIVSRLV